MKAGLAKLSVGAWAPSTVGGNEAGVYPNVPLGDLRRAQADLMGFGDGGRRRFVVFDRMRRYHRRYIPTPRWKMA